MVWPVSAPVNYTALSPVAEQVVFLPSATLRNVTITKTDTKPNTFVSVYADGVFLLKLTGFATLPLYTLSRITLIGDGSAQVQILDPLDPLGLDFLGPMRVTDPPAPWARPTVFPANFQVWCQPFRTAYGETRMRYWTDIDYKMLRVAGWQAYATYWVDPVNGLDTNAGTQAAPYQSVWKALNARAGTQCSIYAKPGVYGQKVDGTKQGWCDQNITADKLILRWGDSGRIVLSNHYTDAVWTATPDGKVWQTTVGANGAGNVLDSRNLDIFGDYTLYQRVNQFSELTSSPGSYYIVGTTVYVRTIDGRVPDADIRVMGNNRNGRVITDDINVFAEYCDFEGGAIVFNAAQTNAASVTPQVVVTYDCSFKYSSALASDNPGCYMRGNALYVAYRCVAAKNAEDGFDMNYITSNATDGTGDGRKFIVFDSVSRNNGNYIASTAPGSEVLNNGFTSHNSCVGIWGNCVSYNNNGFNFHDSLGARVWLMGCGAWDSRAADSANNGDFRISQDGVVAYATAWWYDCYSRKPNGQPSGSAVSWEVKNYATAYIRRHDTAGLPTTTGATSTSVVPV